MELEYGGGWQNNYSLVPFSARVGMVKKARSSAKQSASKAGAPVPAAEQQPSNAQLPASSSHDAAEARSNGAALGTSERPARIYADGIYDLFHFGHARSLEQAKRLFPHTYLMVGCCNDAVTHKYKGKTVFTEEERYESLRHCKWVDEVIPDAPWVVTPEFLEQHNIDFVAHDDLPYADASGACDDVYGPVKRMGKFMATQRTEGVSTSDIILRILKDYNEYVLRNLSRGYSRKDLGISLVKEQRIRVSNNIRQLSERLKEQRLRVADRITKRVLGNRPTQQRLLVAAAAAANGANGERTGMPRSGSNPSLMGLPAEVLEARRHELADLIRRNGEEFAQNVETVVEKVMLGEYGKEVTQAAEQLTQHVDRFVSGSIRQFEEGYSKLESALRSGFAKKQKGGAKVPRGAVAAAVGNAMHLDSSGPESSG